MQSSMSAHSSMSKPSRHTIVSSSDDATQAAKTEFKRKLQEKAQQENVNLWQHPFVDVLKHFKLLPGSDFKLNKKAGDVNEYFAKEIGRRAISIEGSISANNYVQLPNPSGNVKTLGLTGRYVYFQVKSPRHGLPFSYHIDLGMAERSHGIRISISNLFKNFNTQNGFVAQVPLELKNNCWSVVVLDLYEILKKSNILPSTYLIDGSYQIRCINVCANTHLRGVFTSDNMYDFVTLPADMRYKFAFDLAKWPEYFDWQALPQDWSQRKGKKGELSGDENMNLQNLISQQNKKSQVTKEEQRMKMRQEIDEIIGAQGGNSVSESDHIDLEEEKRKKYEEMQAQLNMQFNAGPGDHPVSGFIAQDEEEASGSRSKKDYKSGQYSGYELQRSHKLNKDPIMELKHIIGYQADKCLNIKWSKQDGENVVIFTSGGTLIAMDSETNEQKRFFFGHSAPVCCFDVCSQGSMLASAQEGKNSIIRVWDYATARCITMMTMPVVSLKCLSFSHDGKYLASVGKDSHNKELVIIWDISSITRGGKPEIIARQISEFNVLCLKFSPIDSSRMASCGKENIRFWRIRDTGNIRGSAVVLNHHARNTVFTCLDFEYGFKSADKAENESLKRIFVGSKHGMVFQVNYQTETLEATYKTNDGAIYSIAVNDAFCVTGSEDSYLRVWPLDFQEFFMEAQHEGTVSAVDISADGLKVVCGTMYGSIGILDKSNQNYKTLLRSHTGEILAMDFHKQKHNIITVSRDKTIRLWDIDTNDEVYEFSSPVDQPLCVSAHPTLSIFACGFESGKMRIFDIETTEVVDEFSQFNKPLQSLRYDNAGKLLIACCQDGSVSIHNAARQHLPIKMMHLELPPEFVYVAFSERVMGTLDDSNQKFGVLGEYGNNINIYDSETFLIQHQIQVNHIIKSFKFANNNRDLVVVTKDCKIRFYSLMKYEGIFLREVSNCHRGSITGMAISENSGYMITAGEDNMVKVWDYEAQKTVPYYFQSFIGHTYCINDLIFNPRNNNQVFSIGEHDGIFMWEFNGDTHTDYKQAELAGQDMPSMGTMEEKPASLLEQIRTTNKEKKRFRNQMSEDSFIIPQFKPFEQSGVEYNTVDFFEPPTFVMQQRADRKLSYTHYSNCCAKVDVEPESTSFMSGGSGKASTLEQKLVNGYDGYGGVHDNLVWNVTGGLTYFTLNNKFIIENTKTREQTVFADSQVQFSCIAASVDNKIVAVGEGATNPQGQSTVYIYDIEKKKLLNKLNFHQKGVQSMAFSADSKYLITLGAQGDDALAIWDISQGLTIKSALVRGHATNQVKVDPFVESGHIQFITVGNDAALTVWRFDTENSDQLAFYDVAAPENLKGMNFLSIEFTQRLPAPASTYYVLIGASDGSLVAYDQQKQSYVDVGTRGQVIDGEIGAISIKNSTVVMASSKGLIAHYPIVGTQVQPDSPDMIEHQNVESAIIAICMDELNNEGLVGTEAGCIHYVNFQERIIIKLVSSNNKNHDAIDFCKYDPYNQSIFMTSCGKKSDELKLFTSQNCDQVMNFQSNFDEDGHVVFVISSKTGKKTKRLVGFSNGVIKKVSFNSLSVEHCFKVNLMMGEKLTCGWYSENEINFAFGTSYGTVFLGSLYVHGRNRVEASYCRIDNICKQNTFMDKRERESQDSKLNIDLDDGADLDIDIQNSQEDLDQFTGVSSIHFPSIDPIGTMLVAFDDGTIKLWQSTVKNEQYLKILELQQASKKKTANQPVVYDIAQIGYQQFDMIDSFDIFENPHGLEEVSEFDKQQLKSLYSGKKHTSCVAEFAPGTSNTDQYYAFVDSLAYIFIRNYSRGEIIKRISLSMFPTCMKMIDTNKIKFDEDAALKDITKGKGNFLVALGTKEGKVLVYRIGSVSHNKLFQTKGGISFGAITALDVTPDGVGLIAASQTGEMFQYDLSAKLNAE